MSVPPDKSSGQAEYSLASAGKAQSLLNQQRSGIAGSFLERIQDTGNPSLSRRKMTSQVAEAEDPSPPSSDSQELMDRLSEAARFRRGHSRIEAVADYLAGKFDKENLFGSLFLLALSANTLQGVVAGLNQKKTVETAGGSVLQKDVDKTRIFGALASVSVTMWTFLSSRKGEVPDGDTPAQRMWDTLKHPDRSQVQAREMLILPITLLTVLGNLYYGAGLNRHKEVFPDGLPSSPRALLQGGSAMMSGGVPMRLFQAATSVATTYLAFSSLFGKEAEQAKMKEKAKEEAGTEQEKPPRQEEKKGESAVFSKSESKNEGGKLFYPLRLVKVTWDNNPKLVISSALSFLSSVAVFTEGNVKRNALRKRPDYTPDQAKEFRALLSMGILGMLLNLCGQIYRASQLEKEASEGMSR